MKKASLIVIMLVLSINVFAQNEKSLLWEITGKGLKKPSYLFGTIHITNKAVFDFPDSVFAKITKCEATAFEINMDSTSSKIMEMMQKKSKSNSLDNYFDKKEIAKIQSDLRRNQINIENLEKKSPYELIKKLQQTKSARKKNKEMETFVDAYLFSKAKLLNKTLIGLETIEDQLNVLNQLKKEDLKSIIESSLDTAEVDEVNEMDRLVKLYIDQNIESIYNYIHVKKDVDWENLLLTKRNHVMDHRIDSIIHINSTFICVGTAHLAGEEGLISLLRKRGYEVKALISPKTGYYKKLLPDENIDNWVEYKDNVLGFKIKTPGVPSPMNMQGVEAMGYVDILTSHFYMFFTSPAAGTKDEYYKQFLDGLKNKGELSGKHFFKTPSYEGLEVDCKIGKIANFKIRTIVVGKKAYILMLGAEKLFNKNYATRFFESFELIESKDLDYIDFKDDTLAFQINVPSNFKSTTESETSYSSYKTFTCLDQKLSAHLGVTVIDYLPSYYVADLNELYDNAVNPLAERLDATITNTIDTTIEGYKAKEYILDYKSNIRLYAKYVLRGNRLYVIFAEYNTSFDEDKIKEKLSSFKFLDHKKPDIKKYSSTENDFSVLASSNFVSSFDSTETDDLPHYSYKGSWGTSSKWLEINSYKFDKYDYYKSDSALNVQFRDYFVNTGDSLVDSLITNKPNEKSFTYKFRCAQNQSIEKVGKLFINGADYYTILTVRDLNCKSDTLSNTIINSFKVTKQDKSFDILKPKTTQLLKDVTSNVDSVFTKASKKIKTYEFLKTDIPAIELAAKQTLLDDTISDEETKSQLYQEIYALLDSAEQEKYIAKNYYSYPDSGYVRVNAIAMLAKIHTSSSLKLWQEYVSSFEFSKSIEPNYYGLQGPLDYDSIPEIKELYPMLFKQLDRPDFRGLFYDITNNALNNNIISPSLYEKYKQVIYNEAITEYEKLLMPLDTNFNYYNGNFYEAVNLLNALPISEDVAQLNRKIISDPISANKLGAFKYLIINNQSYDKKLLNTFIKNPINRLDFYEELVKVNRLDLFPTNYKKQKYLAEGDMIRAAYFDDISTGKVEFIEERKIPNENKRYFIYKVKYEYDESYLGIAGPYPLSDKELVSSGTKTSVSIESFDSMTIDEHMKMLLEENQE